MVLLMVLVRLRAVEGFVFSSELRGIPARSESRFCRGESEEVRARRKAGWVDGFGVWRLEERRFERPVG